MPNVIEIATSTTSNRNWVADAVLRYQHTFAARHALTATLTYLRQQYERTLENRMQTRYSSSFFRFEKKLSRPIHSPSASFVYTCDGRYEVQGSLRAEMVFGPGNFADNSRLLPGGQLSWHAHKEAFLAEATGLSDLTLWAGVGQPSTFFSTAPPTTMPACAWACSVAASPSKPAPTSAAPATPKPYLPNLYRPPAA